MPSEKRDVIERIFLERLASAKLSDTEQNERFFLLDRHINVSINNMKMSNVRDFGRCRYFVFNMRVQLHWNISISFQSGKKKQNKQPCKPTVENATTNAVISTAPDSKNAIVNNPVGRYLSTEPPPLLPIDYGIAINNVV